MRLLVTGYLHVGRIVAAQGIKGEVRVYPESDFPERFLEPGTRWVLPPGATQPQPMELVKGRFLEGKGLYVMQFAEIRDRTQAEACRNAEILVPEGDRPALEEGEFHVGDLLGLPVYDQATQALIGTVKRVVPAGNDLLEIERVSASGCPTPKTLLVPFVMAIVPVVDLAQRRIELTPPEGLLDL